jgi:hypothetical protein
VHTATTNAVIAAVSTIFLAPGLNRMPTADTLTGGKPHPTVVPLKTN